MNARMHSTILRYLALAASWLSAFAANAAEVPPLAADFDARNWASIGRTAGETHYSPLSEINRDTVGRLRLAWTLDLDVSNAMSTPLAVDGVVYVAAGFSIVHAVDARTGQLLWRFDPNVLEVAGKKLRAASGIRGLAHSKGRLFVGTLDGRLLALDAKKGSVLWSTPTLSASDGTFISGAPRAFDDKVAIGFGDTGVVRGAVAVYDAASGARLWRWEAPAGGGAVWNAITFDPETHRLYAGTGNARGPDAAANRAACSIIALNADTGAPVWQYDTAPGDHTQCDSGTDITLATINVGGQPRNVILHAPRDGTFHVIDRATGAGISSKKLGVGVHNHFAQAFSPKTGMIYLPTTELPASNPDGDAPADAGKSALLAWDPAKQRAAWAVPTPGAFSGGVLVTAGDLVFQGQADGYLTAYSTEGRRLWAFYSAAAALGAPISYAIGKRQYISILNGPTQGMPGSLGAMSARFGWDSRLHPRRLLTFVLDGAATLPATPKPATASPIDGPLVQVDDALAKEGAVSFAQCQWCHGAGAIAGGGAPDLRTSIVPLGPLSFAAVVRGGVDAKGMPKFEELSDRELEALRHYIRARARKVTRPDGVAPVVPEIPAPVPDKPVEPPAEPARPPGSLESTPPPPQT
jgi:quinohemoprotein ethanol dehydrogenase